MTNDYSKSVVVRPHVRFDGVQVFSATMKADRETLGERVTAWVDANEVDVVEYVVTQSSDREFHCVAITVFYRARAPGA